MNYISLIGRVGKDPETRTLESGKVTKFTLAVSEKHTKNGEKVEETEWFNVVIFGKLAEIAEKYVSKGDMIFVSGKMKSREYEDKEGVKKRFYEVLVSNLEMLGSKKDRSSEATETDSAEIFPHTDLQREGEEARVAHPPSHRIPAQDPPDLGEDVDRLPF